MVTQYSKLWQTILVWNLLFNNGAIYIYVLIMSTVGIIFIFYLFFLIAVGLRSIRFNKSQEDYLLAGRRLGPWVTAFSERASGESAWLLLALPGAAISVGLGEIWTVVGITLGIIA